MFVEKFEIFEKGIAVRVKEAPSIPFESSSAVVKRPKEKTAVPHRNPHGARWFYICVLSVSARIHRSAVEAMTFHFSPTPNKERLSSSFPGIAPSNSTVLCVD